MEHLKAEGRSIWIWPSAFAPSECDVLALDPGWPAHPIEQRILDAPEAAERLGSIFSARMPGAPRGGGDCGWLPHVTFSRAIDPICWHTDYPRGARYKAYAYLTESPGTLFSRKERVLVPGHQGTIVLFDIALEHCGEEPRGPHPRTPKRLIGLRPVPAPVG